MNQIWIQKDSKTRAHLQLFVKCCAQGSLVSTKSQTTFELCRSEFQPQIEASWKRPQSLGALGMLFSGLGGLSP